MSAHLVQAHRMPRRAAFGGAPSSDASAGAVHITARGPQGVLRLVLRSVPVTLVGRENPAVRLNTPRLPGHVHAGLLIDEHLLVCVDGHDASLSPIADVLVQEGRAGAPPGRPVPGAEGPSAALVACGITADGRCAVSVHGKVEAAFAGVPSRMSGVLPWVGCFTHSWLVSGRNMEGLRSTRLTVGGLGSPSGSLVLAPCQGVLRH